VRDRHLHQVCFSGPKDIAALIEAAERAGFRFEFGSTSPEEGFVGDAEQRAEAQRELGQLRTRLADRRGEPSD
jgi:hypothetical protein